jgi:hypothetical protein
MEGKYLRHIVLIVLWLILCFSPFAVCSSHCPYGKYAKCGRYKG